MPFTNVCKFEQAGAKLSGTCTDTTNKKSYAVSAGTVSAGHIQWSYMIHYLTFKFAVTFTGALLDQSINGSVAGPKLSGSFTATRP